MVVEAVCVGMASRRLEESDDGGLKFARSGPSSERKCKNECTHEGEVQE